MANKTRLTRTDFNRLLAETQISTNTRQALREVLVNGKTLVAAGEQYGITKQFLSKKLRRLRYLAESLDIEM